MRWTLGLMLLGTLGCGYRQTRMVACPETGCPKTYAESSPQGLKGPRERARAAEPLPMPVVAPPLEPLPDNEPPPPVYPPTP